MLDDSLEKAGSGKQIVCVINCKVFTIWPVEPQESSDSLQQDNLPGCTKETVLSSTTRSGAGVLRSGCGRKCLGTYISTHLTVFYIRI